jgi:cytochrome c oxidase subunit 2
MISQDVIHSFYVPDFRIKQDVLPSRYTTAWFEATQPGTYRLDCAEYCGVDHSRMGGSVIAMAPADFATWLQQGSSLSPAGAGRRLFQQYGCATCHEGNRAPNLDGVYGRPVLLRGGQTIVADDNYVRESILRPSAKVVEGYDPIMPSYTGLLTEDEVLQLVAYVRSIGAPAGSQSERPRLLPVPTAQGGP